LKTANKETLLIKKIREGDEHAFEIVFLKYYTPLCRFSWKYVHSEVLSEEIVQEVFAQIWEKRLQLDVDGHLRGLLYDATRNKALNYIKHQKIVDDYILEARQKMNDNIYSLTSSTDKKYEEVIRVIDKVVEELPPKSKRIYKLNREEGLTYREIADYLEISVKTVESQMSRVLKILRVRLSQFLPIGIIAFLYFSILFQ
jgi:RNA polymerase sigma-70 factor (ECF subfamily)